MTLGEQIRKFRKEKNWTQNELAEKVGVHGRHLSKIENDHVNPTRKLKKKFAETFEISIDELTGDFKKSSLTLLDPELQKQLQELAKLDLDEEDKIVIKRLLGAMIITKQMQSLLKNNKAC